MKKGLTGAEGGKKAKDKNFITGDETGSHARVARSRRFPRKSCGTGESVAVAFIDKLIAGNLQEVSVMRMHLRNCLAPQQRPEKEKEKGSELKNLSTAQTKTEP